MAIGDVNRNEIYANAGVIACKQIPDKILSILGLGGVAIVKQKGVR
jgi:hypothetical protein